MRRTIMNTAAVAAAMLLIPGVLAAQTADTVAPRIENARIEKRSLTQPLTAAVTHWTDQAAQPQWLGYGVPQVHGDRTVAAVITAIPGTMDAERVAWKAATMKTI